MPRRLDLDGNYSQESRVQTPAATVLFVLQTCSYIILLRMRRAEILLRSPNTASC